MPKSQLVLTYLANINVWKDKHPIGFNKLTAECSLMEDRLWGWD